MYMRKEEALFFEDHGPEYKPDPLFQQLLSHEKVIITGHQAFLTETALDNIAQTTFLNIEAYLSSEQTKNFLV